jgi:hypothetical protein
MKYFAKLGLNSKVVGVTHVGDEYAPTEKVGIEYLHKHTNYPFWIEYTKTSTDGNYLRKNPALIGMTYDEDRDAFIAPQPYNSWTLNEATCRWEAPVAKPNDDKQYNWNESITNWVVINS